MSGRNSSVLVWFEFGNLEIGSIAPMSCLFWNAKEFALTEDVNSNI